MPNRFSFVLAVPLLVACNSSEAPVAAPAPTAAPVAPAASSSGPVTAASAPAPAPSTVEKKLTFEEKTFTHPKLPIAFSYPATLTLKQDATGATLFSETLATTTDRSGRSDKPIALQLSIRVTHQPGDVVKVATRRIPNLAESFPQGTAESFKESEGYAEKVTLGQTTAYRFIMGSHGENEELTLVPHGKSTLVVACGFVGGSLASKLDESVQLEMCHRVVDTLKL